MRRHNPLAVFDSRIGMKDAKAGFGRRVLSNAELREAYGGFSYAGFRRSENIEDRREEPQWTPTEDGRLVGPHGEWAWDTNANRSLPYRYDEAPRPGDIDQASLQRAQDAELNLQDSPRYQDLQNYVGDALDGRLSPTETGDLIGSNGRAYHDHTTNWNQPVPEHTPEPGEYVGRGNPDLPPWSTEPGNRASYYPGDPQLGQSTAGPSGSDPYYEENAYQGQAATGPDPYYEENAYQGQAATGPDPYYEENAYQGQASGASESYTSETTSTEDSGYVPEDVTETQPM